MLGYAFLRLWLFKRVKKPVQELEWEDLTLSTDQVSGEKHLRHQMTKDGFYKGRLVKDLRKPVKEDQEQE